MRAIVFKSPDGEFAIPLEKIIEERTDYYACEVDGFEKGSKDWQEEFDYGMKDNYEGLDWLQNNSDLEDWNDIMFKISDKRADEDSWRDSDNFEIKDVTPLEYNI